MPGLGLSSVTLSDYPTGLNTVTFDVDPQPYNPFSVAIRGSSTKVLDGTVLHQFFGLQKADFTLQLQGYITEYATVQALWTKYIQGGGGQQFTLTDWYVNKFRVTFAPGVDSFHPIPVPGACGAHTYTMSLVVLDVMEWFSGAYG
jgi:hypothetical protein